VSGQHAAEGRSERSVTIIKVTPWSDCLHNDIEPECESEYYIGCHDDGVRYWLTNKLYNGNIELAPIFLNMEHNNNGQYYHIGEGVCNTEIIISAGFSWIPNQNGCPCLDKHDNDVGQHCDERQWLGPFPSFRCHPESELLIENHADERLEAGGQNPRPPGKLKEYHLPGKERCVHRAKPAIPLNEGQNQ